MNCIRKIKGWNRVSGLIEKGYSLEIRGDYGFSDQDEGEEEPSNKVTNWVQELERLGGIVLYPSRDHEDILEDNIALLPTEIGIILPDSWKQQKEVIYAACRKQPYYIEEEVIENVTLLKVTFDW